tara:strand:- start:422 stop:763 length:342 start_codon:yes stop_codon:yes gene_type:complete
MFGELKKKKIILREQRHAGDYRYLGAEIKDNGDLVFEGQDLGTTVENVFGHREYEWYWTIKASDIAKFQDAIGSQDNILKLLQKHFTNDKAAGLSQFMQAHNIPFESWSRIGD